MIDKIKYLKDSAGDIMVSNVPIVVGEKSVLEVEKILNDDINKFSTINYIYIIDHNEMLIGAISIKDLYGSPKDMRVKDLISAELISVLPNTDKEKVAMLAIEKSLKAVPVVDDHGFLLGVVSSDDILRILHEESMENLLRLGGVVQDAPYEVNIFSTSLSRSLRNRLPWLIVGLLGGLLAAFVVSSFESVLNKNIILASFIPLVVYMSAAVGSQMQAFIIRDLAFDKNDFNFSKYLLKHTRVVLVMSVIISILLYLMVLFLYNASSIGIVLAISLFFAIITSIFTGLVIPYLFYKMKLDPADASGPIATILQDILSVLVYLLVAYIML
ncbi:MAG: magnesium transporter [Patescibacteria group bacterium]